MKRTHEKSAIQPPVPLREALLERARELFDSEGYENVSMRRIGAEVGCSAMAMYRYFEDKEDLLLSICEETFAKVSKKRQKSLDPRAAPVEQLRAVMRVSIDFGIQHPSRYKLVFMTNLSGSPASKRKAAIINASFDFYCKLVRNCAEKNGFTCDVDATVRMLRAGVHGIISGTITNTLGRHSRTMKRQTREQLIEALTRDLV